MASKSAVDGLERRLEGQAIVVRMNVDEEAGWQVASRHRALVTPTFVVFGPDGEEVYREYGYPDTGRIEEEALRQSGSSTPSAPG